MYTAQGEFLCRPNVEKYGDVEYYANPTMCGGVQVNSASDCDTCGKLQAVVKKANLPFDPKKFPLCSKPDGNWKDSCRSAAVNSTGTTPAQFSAECKVDGVYPPRNSTTQKPTIDLISCASGRINNDNGKLVCEQIKEHYVNNPTVDCYGIKVNSKTDCDTCGKVKNVYKTKKWAFDATKVDLCKAPNGSWSQTCKPGTVDKSGIFKTTCTGDISNSFDLTSCSSGIAYNKAGKLTCQ
jgi:hypothetical protein